MSDKVSCRTNAIGEIIVSRFTELQLAGKSVSMANKCTYTEMVQAQCVSLEGEAAPSHREGHGCKRRAW